jgi:hypothetical protein
MDEIETGQYLGEVGTGGLSQGFRETRSLFRNGTALRNLAIQDAKRVCLNAVLTVTAQTRHMAFEIADKDGAVDVTISCLAKVIDFEGEARKAKLMQHLP